MATYTDEQKRQLLLRFDAQIKDMHETLTNMQHQFNMMGMELLTGASLVEAEDWTALEEFLVGAEAQDAQEAAKASKQ